MSTRRPLHPDRHRPGHARDWTTGDSAADCAALQYCGEYDTMADEAGTGFRFEGKTQDLEGNSQDFIDAPDIGVGVALGEIKAYHRPSGAAPDDTAPGPAQQVTVTGTWGGALVSWQAADATSCETPNLTDGETYYVAVNAISALGEGRTASRVEAVAGAPGPFVPPEPRSVRLAPGPNRLVVTWTTPESDGGAPVDYYSVRAYRVAVGGRPVAGCEVQTPGVPAP